VLELSPIRRIIPEPEEDSPAVSFFENSHPIRLLSKNIVGKSQSPPTNSTMERTKRRPEETMQPPNQASQRLTSFRTLLSSADAGATSFDDFEEVLAQELHDVEDWMSLSRPAIEVLMIYAVRAIRAPIDTSRFENGLQYLSDLSELLDYHKASATASRLLDFLSSAYDSRSRDLLDVLRRLEKISTHSRTDSSLQSDNPTRALVFHNDIDNIEGSMEQEQEEEDEDEEVGDKKRDKEEQVEEEEEQQQQQQEEEEEEEGDKEKQDDDDDEKDEVQEEEVQEKEVQIQNQAKEEQQNQQDLEEIPIQTKSIHVACQTEFNTLEQENKRLKNALNHVDLLLSLKVASTGEH
jgi:hypothetical protein